VRQRISFTLKQSGWKLLRYNEHKALPNNKSRRARGVVDIQGEQYKFVQHRPMYGTVKTVMIKRDAADRLWLIFSVVEQMELPEATTPSRVAGFDFGLKTFLTDHTGREYTSPLCHQHALRRLRVVQSRKDKKRHQSNNRRKAALYLARMHIGIADQRRDAHFKLAHELCKQYDVLYFEDLNIEGMKALWGRKVSDLAFSKFMAILKHIAMKQGKIVLEIGRFERTTGKCSKCGHIQAMTLRQRVFGCQECGFVLGRDHNAAINILNAGKTLSAGASASTTLVAVSRVRKTTRRHARR
jgi:putative transposase